MCNCVEDLEKRIKEKAIENNEFKKPVERVQMAQKGFLIKDGVPTITYSEFNVHLKGQQKPKKTNVIHSFCPFCGKEKNNQ